VPVIEVTQSGGDPPVTLYDTVRPGGDPDAASHGLREGWRHRPVDTEDPNAGRPFQPEKRRAGGPTPAEQRPRHPQFRFPRHLQGRPLQFGFSVGRL